MSDLLITFIEFLFYPDSEKEITLKTLLIIILKIIIFLLLLSFVLWLLLKNN